ncbi:SDR family NAD(P)-dependent oxidoreductase [Rouxiella badensis]|jgi:3-oxoacyl-[acyl-carrier protein] reductase|uniref:Short-chain dehydrogenase n=1 Tax=Rouxiella badensis TaxID=1646377 RepID=A0A1X0WEZ6_9GAMM|nr:SDR family NAD(P)-dependent oxidoreductase [Rouxiella badensis]MCC3703792.1 SDR family oxidoreductase [Rouxiella badensis]MCC3719820.1 SDR family oxidoreductase [Rouxiella badensis]MCC3729328.1 SDR family oxidoreductase [Rouxiella badensis]MCC3734744.1 SDR family oxidoreductase [Rouxiella badensis]MCC3741495.1 SDR family oxidoreductase [Rouxiella badensis]
MQNPFDYSHRTVLVTGAAQGFGRAICLAFAQRGARVIACDIQKHLVEETAALCGETALAYEVDISSPEAISVLFSSLEARHLSVDTLVNNAGGVVGQQGQPLEEVTFAQWQAIVAVNLNGAFLMSQAAVVGMKAHKFGRIINISSRAGLDISLTGIQAYASAKAGQIGLTRQLAHELGPWNITVNNVAPGFIRSNPSTEKQWEAMGSEGQKRLIDNIALKRLGVAEDIAHAVLYFASDWANWVTGQILSVDGGK